MRALFALFALVLPVVSSADPDISLLIARLGDEDPARRDDAQKALLGAGDAALPAVEEALADPGYGDAEIRARLRNVVESLRWEKAFRDAPEDLARGDAGTCADCRLERLEEEPLASVFGATKVYGVICPREGTARTLLLGESLGQRIFVEPGLPNLLDIAPLMSPVKTGAAAVLAIRTLARLADDPRGERERTMFAYRQVEVRGEGRIRLQVYLSTEKSWDIVFGTSGRIESVTEGDGC